jgi:L-alanine-DL-glutamate epimerase-like enolase superfamily enzyme
MGVILNQPVYKLIGNRDTKEVPLYSGMIYLDELNPGNETKGIDAVIENCQWDVDYGYRQLKVKIGRSGRWYKHDEGLAKDIEIVKLIHDTFKDKGVEVLVDANDMYSIDDTKKFLEGIGDIPLFWVEEPFREEINHGKELRKWMNQNGFKKTYYADGERNPDFDVCLELGKNQHMDVFLPDTYSYGFTKWIRLMPELQKVKMLASPHAWGNRLKTNYTIHLSAGLGNICTVEGVTCLSDDIDYGDYPIVNGKVQVSEAPGFGMKLPRH